MRGYFGVFENTQGKRKEESSKSDLEILENGFERGN